MRKWAKTDESGAFGPNVILGMFLGGWSGSLEDAGDIADGSSEWRPVGNEEQASIPAACPGGVFLERNQYNSFWWNQGLTYCVKVGASDIDDAKKMVIKIDAKWINYTGKLNSLWVWMRSVHWEKFSS